MERGAEQGLDVTVSKIHQAVVVDIPLGNTLFIFEILLGRKVKNKRHRKWGRAIL